MKILLQRVNGVKVEAEGRIVSESGKGLLLLVGIGKLDDGSEIPYFADKVINLRIFEDGNGKMNLSVKDISGEICAVSQFTLYADTKKGRRPGFSLSAPPAKAFELYSRFVGELKKSNLKVSEGIFGAHMDITLINSGPATFMLE